MVHLACVCLHIKIRFFNHIADWMRVISWGDMFADSQARIEGNANGIICIFEDSENLLFSGCSTAMSLRVS